LIEKRTYLELLISLYEKEDISELKSEIAADIVVAKLALEYEKTKVFDKERCKEIITEYF